MPHTVKEDDTNPLVPEQDDPENRSMVDDVLRIRPGAKLVEVIDSARGVPWEVAA